MLTVRQLHDARFEKAKINRETYKQITAGIFEKIRRRGGPAGAFECNVPTFVYARPFYELSHAVRYVTHKLHAGGFGASEVAPGRIRIEWSAPRMPRRREVKKPKPVVGVETILGKKQAPPPPAKSTTHNILRDIKSIKSKFNIA